MFLRGLGGRWGGREENCQEVVPRGVMLADEVGLFLPESHSLLGHSFQDRALPGGDLGLDTAHHFDGGVLTALGTSLTFVLVLCCSFVCFAF